MKANNEKAKHSIELQKNLQEYENMWQESGDNKYSDENYDRYLSGLNEIYDTAKMNFATTKYTRESDVLNWENSIDEDRNKSIFMQNGEKAKFDIQAVTDETLTNVSAMANNYIMNGNYQDLQDAVALLDGLSDFIPKHQLDEMKRKQVMNAERNKMNNDIERIVNSSMSVEEKRNSLDKLREGIANNKKAYDYMGKQAVEMGLYSDEKVAISDYQAMYNEALNTSGGIINRFETQIRDEKYRNDVARENYRYKLEEERYKTKETIIKAINGRDDIKAINLIEGRTVTPEDMVSSEVLAKRYYGNTPHEILKENNGVEYIPTVSTYEVNQVKNKFRIDEENKVDRNEQIAPLIEDINSTENLDVRENKKREYIANGLTSQLEVSLSDGSVSSDFIPSTDAITYSHIGKKNSGKNKLNNLGGISPSQPLGVAIGTIKDNYYKREQVSEIITGAILNGRFGVIFSGKEITPQAVNVAMKGNKDFEQFVIETVKLVNQLPSKKYRKANMNIKEDIDAVVDKRFSELKGLQLRQSTKEKGTDYKVDSIMNVKTVL